MTIQGIFRSAKKEHGQYHISWSLDDTEKQGVMRSIIPDDERTAHVLAGATNGSKIEIERTEPGLFKGDTTSIKVDGKVVFEKGSVIEGIFRSASKKHGTYRVHWAQDDHDKTGVMQTVIPEKGSMAPVFAFAVDGSKIEFESSGSDMFRGKVMSVKINNDIAFQA